MSENGAVSEFSSHDISTFLHHTEVGEAIRQTPFERDTYLGVAKIFGLRNKEYLMENLQGLKVGDRVTLYRKYNSESPDSTAVQVSNIPDDGSSIRVHTLAGLCLGYIQYPERYILAELMKAGKHLYARIHELNVPGSIEELDTRSAVTLDIYWMQESNPMKLANTYAVGDPAKKYEAMEQNGNSIWLLCTGPDRYTGAVVDTADSSFHLKKGDRLRLLRRGTKDNPERIEIWTDDMKHPLGQMEPWDTPILAYMLDAGKHVYGVFKEYSGKDSSLNIRFDVYVEDN